MRKGKGRNLHATPSPASAVSLNSPHSASLNTQPLSTLINEVKDLDFELTDHPDATDNSEWFPRQCNVDRSPTGTGAANNIINDNMQVGSYPPVVSRKVIERGARGEPGETREKDKRGKKGSSFESAAPQAHPIQPELGFTSSRSSVIKHRASSFIRLITQCNEVKSKLRLPLLSNVDVKTDLSEESEQVSDVERAIKRRRQSHDQADELAAKPNCSELSSRQSIAKLVDIAHKRGVSSSEVNEDIGVLENTDSVYVVAYALSQVCAHLLRSKSESKAVRDPQIISSIISLAGPLVHHLTNLAEPSQHPPPLHLQNLTARDEFIQCFLVLESCRFINSSLLWVFECGRTGTQVNAGTVDGTCASVAAGGDANQGASGEVPHYTSAVRLITQLQSVSNQFIIAKRELVNKLIHPTHRAMSDHSTLAHTHSANQPHSITGPHSQSSSPDLNVVSDLITLNRFICRFTQVVTNRHLRGLHTSHLCVYPTLIRSLATNKSCPLTQRGNAAVDPKMVSDGWRLLLASMTSLTSTSSNGVEGGGEKGERADDDQRGERAQRLPMGEAMVIVRQVQPHSSGPSLSFSPNSTTKEVAIDSISLTRALSHAELATRISSSLFTSLNKSLQRLTSALNTLDVYLKKVNQSIAHPTRAATESLGAKSTASSKLGDANLPSHLSSLIAAQQRITRHSTFTAFYLVQLTKMIRMGLTPVINDTVPLRVEQPHWGEGVNEVNGVIVGEATGLSGRLTDVGIGNLLLPLLAGADAVPVLDSREMSEVVVGLNKLGSETSSIESVKCVPVSTDLKVSGDLPSPQSEQGETCESGDRNKKAESSDRELITQHEGDSSCSMLRFLSLVHQLINSVRVMGLARSEDAISDEVSQVTTSVSGKLNMMFEKLSVAMPIFMSILSNEELVCIYQLLNHGEWGGVACLVSSPSHRSELRGLNMVSFITNSGIRGLHSALDAVKAHSGRESHSTIDADSRILLDISSIPLLSLRRAITHFLLSHAAAKESAHQLTHNGDRGINLDLKPTTLALRFISLPSLLNTTDNSGPPTGIHDSFFSCEGKAEMRCIRSSLSIWLILYAKAANDKLWWEEEASAGVTTGGWRAGESSAWVDVAPFCHSLNLPASDGDESHRSSNPPHNIRGDNDHVPVSLLAPTGCLSLRPNVVLTSFTSPLDHLRDLTKSVGHLNVLFQRTDSSIRAARGLDNQLDHPPLQTILRWALFSDSPLLVTHAIHILTALPIARCRLAAFLYNVATHSESSSMSPTRAPSECTGPSSKSSRSTHTSTQLASPLVIAEQMSYKSMSPFLSTGTKRQGQPVFNRPSPFDLLNPLSLSQSDRRKPIDINTSLVNRARQAASVSSPTGTHVYFSPPSRGKNDLDLLLHQIATRTALLASLPHPSELHKRAMFCLAAVLRTSLKTERPHTKFSSITPARSEGPEADPVTVVASHLAHDLRLCLTFIETHLTPEHESIVDKMKQAAHLTHSTSNTEDCNKGPTAFKFTSADETLKQFQDAQQQPSQASQPKYASGYVHPHIPLYHISHLMRTLPGSILATHVVSPFGDPSQAPSHRPHSPQPPSNRTASASSSIQQASNSKVLAAGSIYDAVDTAASSPASQTHLTEQSPITSPHSTEPLECVVGEVLEALLMVCDRVSGETKTLVEMIKEKEIGAGEMCVGVPRPVLCEESPLVMLVAEYSAAVSRLNAKEVVSHFGEQLTSLFSQYLKSDLFCTTTYPLFPSLYSCAVETMSQVFLVSPHSSRTAGQETHNHSKASISLRDRARCVLDGVLGCAEEVMECFLTDTGGAVEWGIALLLKHDHHGGSGAGRRSEGNPTGNRPAHIADLPNLSIAQQAVQRMQKLVRERSERQWHEQINEIDRHRKRYKESSEGEEPIIGDMESIMGVMGDQGCDRGLGERYCQQASVEDRQDKTRKAGLVKKGVVMDGGENDPSGVNKSSREYSLSSESGNKHRHIQQASAPSTDSLNSLDQTASSTSLNQAASLISLNQAASLTSLDQAASITSLDQAASLASPTDLLRAKKGENLQKGGSLSTGDSDTEDKWRSTPSCPAASIGKGGDTGTSVHSTFTATVRGKPRGRVPAYFKMPTVTSTGSPIISNGSPGQLPSPKLRDGRKSSPNPSPTSFIKKVLKRSKSFGSVRE
eukprot:GHVN01065784.1.p1 GENE.GHVN01065784.1~~GHVN01065784.1.p1  ORF type:complete len:2152 (-),score=558.67 GHVN01065784.1:2272-8727(-)